ncbi:restriction endonuclease subunit S [Streptomyces sp. NPDC057682]|uniref:restriction endonuclease subunit S n=1 Tax=Streptomyces sp. NPDC057682 TaxID=3346210 RepID=UPI0036AB2DB9
MSSGFNIPIPDSWSWSPLKYISTFLNRGTAPDYVENGPVRVISQAANQATGLDWERTRFHNYSGDPRRIKGYLLPRDVLINSTGTGTLGRVGYFTAGPDNRPCIADGHVTVTRADPQIIDPRYMYYWFISTPFQDYVYSVLISGATNQIELNRERLSGSPTPLPPLAEQRRIADFLDAETARIDYLKAIQEAAKRALLERRAAGLFSAVTGSEIRERIPSTLAWVETLPSTWEAVKLGHVARMGSGHTPSRNKPEWWMDCTIPWVTTGEVSQMRSDRLEVLTETREKISETGLLNSSAEIHPSGTVVLCRTAASAGYSAVMGRDMATSQDLATWTCGPKLDPFFLLWCLRAMRTDLLNRLAMGSTHKTIYMPDLQGLRIPLPDIREQRNIVEVIRSSNLAIDSAADAIDGQLALLAERRQTLITSAVTGQFDITTATPSGGIA